MNKFRSFFKKRRVIIASILYAIFLLQPTLALAGNGAKPESIYTRLATQALPVHAQLKNIFESVDVDLETQAKKPSHDLDIKELSEFEKRNIIFTLFHHYGEKENKKDTEVFVDEYWDDLELFCGPTANKKMSIFNQINRTKTIPGEVVLQRMLSQPTMDVDELVSRQDAVGELVDNEKLLARIQKQLERFKKSESLLLSFWKQENPFNEQIFKNVYYNWPGLKNYNQNAIALEIGTRFSNFINLIFQPFFPTAILFHVIALTNREVEYFKQYPGGNSARICKKNELYSFWDEAKKAWGDRKPVRADSAFYADRAYDSTTKEYYVITNNDKAYRFSGPTQSQFMPAFPVPKAHWNALKKFPSVIKKFKKFLKDSKVSPALRLAALGGLAGTIGFGVWTGYKGIKAAQLKNKISAYIHERLIGVSETIRAMKQAALFIKTNETLASKISTKNIDNLGKQTAKLNELIRLLSTNTFTGKPSFFSFTGRVLAAYKIMAEVKNGLSKALEEFGKIDAYCSTAELFKSFQGKDHKYCFAEYVSDANQPYVDAKDFWFPGLLNDPNLKTVIPNSVTMGNVGLGNPRNILLTGPNKGGKSTILKGLIVSIILAQTLGIAPATSFSLTPFKKIQTYINIADNSSMGLSLFQAELMRAKKLLDTVEKLQPGEFSFNIFDEVFSGTNPEEAIQGSAYIAAILAKTAMLAQQSGVQSANNMSIIATHFGLLTKLEEVTKAYTNYQVTVERQSDGSLVYPYTWEPGISKFKVALDLMKLQKMTDPHGLKVSEKFSKLIDEYGIR
jgi:DNA mismatch repair ATPase MutS